jgi:C-terminal peptidase prc
MPLRPWFGSRALWLLALALLAACSPVLPEAQLPTAIPVPLASPAPTIAPTPRPTAPPTPSATPAPTATATPTNTPAPTFPPLSPTPTLAPLDRATRQQIFDQLWTLVNRRYLYRDFRGVDWNAVRAHYAPQVRAAATPEQFYALLGAMIDELGDQHSHFETPQEVAEEQARAGGQLNYGGIGVSIRTDPNGGLITRLAKDGPAAQAGLNPRDLIVAIGGIPFTDTVGFGAQGPEGAVRGAPGTPVRLSVRSPGSAPREITLVRQIIPDDAFPPVAAQRLPGTQVGLLTIDTFLRDDLLAQVRDHLQSLLAAEPLSGLIIDVRQNGGGSVNQMLDVLGLFVDAGSIGSSGGRQLREDLTIPTGQTLPGLANVPIVVLTSEDTVSAAEMFTAGMRVRGRARIVGTTTAGNTENLLQHTFSDGSRLWLAELAYHLPDGSLLEGVGVRPDRVVEAEWWRYAPADDPQIQAALKELQHKAE